MLAGILPSRLDNLELFPQRAPYVYDPERPPEKDFILDANTEQLETIEEDKKLQVRKWFYFVGCFVSNLIGIILCLMGLGMTVLFETFKHNEVIFGISFIFFVPFILWLKFLFYPDRREYRKRQYLKRNRDWRDALNIRRMKIYHGWDEEEEVEAKRKAEEEARKKKEAERERGRQVVKKVFHYDKENKFANMTSLQKEWKMKTSRLDENLEDIHSLPNSLTSRAYVKVKDGTKYLQARHIPPITDLVNPSVMELPYAEGEKPVRLNWKKGLNAYEVATGLEVRFHV
jgi:hypothetical protein